ncbi:Fic family protein [Tsukamurella sp. NPDC003166]|uniref:Fic/DOC family protein n=1 Tax=Tsukamurella sp. NPDC003166 TaxID=3154444 RepID=UPI0033BC2B95
MSDEVLPNKLGITDPSQLAEYELEVAAARVAEIARDPEQFMGGFDFSHLQRLHAYILQDVYEWAGRMRTTETKAMGMPHCRVEFLAEQTAYVFRQIAASLPLSVAVDEAVETVAGHWGELTARHPFRDGNSRSQRVFFDLMLREAGHPVDWSRVDAAAVHAARHVAMRTLDSSYLAAELRPGVIPDAPAASLSAAQARDAERAIELYRQMLAHRETGAPADEFRRQRGQG